MLTKNHDHMLYCSRDMARDRCNCYFFILGYFLPFYPPNRLKTESLKKLKKKTPVDIIILHNCIKNHDHTIYCLWNKARDECNCYFSFWTIFCTFTPLTAQKIKISEKWKKTWRYHHFTQVYQKSWSYAILFLRYGAWQI